MTWSAGQREFVPLLMGLYWLLPASKVSRRGDLEWVVLEEPETGLHPAAVSAVLLIVLDLLARGYRVCLSTHSPHVLDVVWALQTLKEEGASSDRVLQVFGARRNAQTRSVASSALQKEYRVHYFDVESGTTQEISALDPGSANAVEAGWGGLTDLSGKAADTIAQVLQ
jgi:predicted ATPase